MEGFYASLLKDCSTYSHARELHARIIESGYGGGNRVGAQLMQLYRSLGSLQDVCVAFGHIHKPDVFSRNVLIAAYIEHGRLYQAKQAFDEMEQRSVVTWNSMIAAYARAGHLQQACELFDRMPQRDVVTWTAMLWAYVKVGNVVRARSVFDRMPARNVTAWNAMLAGYAQCGHSDEARELFRRMDLKPDLATFLAVLEACCSPGSLQAGREVHKIITDDGWLDRDVRVGNALLNMYGYRRDVVSWNTMSVVYFENGYQAEALTVPRYMDLEGVKPNEVTYITLLDACAELPKLTSGHHFSRRAVREGYLDMVKVGNAIVDMYGKCGSLRRATDTFQQMEKRDVITWTCLIVGYVQNGHDREAFELFQLMGQEGMEPDQVTFLSILSACTHYGLLSYACAYCLSMQEFNVHPRMDHYACVIDLLARVGVLSEAEDLMASMPFQPNASIPRALLSSCKIHRDSSDRPSRLAEESMKLDPLHASPYIVLSSISTK